MKRIDAIYFYLCIVFLSLGALGYFIPSANDMQKYIIAHREGSIVIGVVIGVCAVLVGNIERFGGK